MSQTPIQNASDIPLSQNGGTLPNVSDVILNWFQAMVFTIVTKTIVNFQLVETGDDINFQGVWQPFSPQQLALKPIGERDWKWFMVHASPNLALTPDQVITYQGTQYRVKEKLDYTNYGYVQYNLIEDYTGSGPTP